VRWGRYADRLDVRAEGERFLHLQDRHIIVGGTGVVVWTHDYGLDVNYFGV